MSYNKLTKKEEDIILHKKTEYPYTGEYENFYEEGKYICKRCNAPLFTSKDKFNAGCGWPNFDKNMPNALNFVLDPDGQRMEIVCKNCGAHLGHSFIGEGFTSTNLRHCPNSLALKFIKKGLKSPKVLNE